MSVIPHANHTLTKRFTNVGSLGQAISFKEWAVKGIAIHFEGSTSIAIIKGSGTVTGSGDAYLTSDGTTLTLDGMWDPGDVITTLYTPTANGADKIVNGAMATDSGVAWAKGFGWALNGVATHTTGNATTLVETTTTVVNGEQYLFVYTLASTTTAGTLTPSAGGVTLTARTKAIGDASATYSEEFTAVSTAKVTFTSDATWAGVIDDVKMYKVTPAVCSVIAWR